MGHPVYNFAPVQAIRDASDDRDAEKNAFFKDFLAKVSSS